MSYYKVLGFEKEPFSTSPDPNFFYLSREHESALTNVIVELRLRRGLSVVLGDIGTGKTTLSRKLIQELKGREDFIFQIVLNPSFNEEGAFLMSLARNFEIENISDARYATELSTSDIMEMMESFLFQKGVNEGKIVTLIIDEAQKLDERSLEVLRGLLNYETNEFKLLQLVLLGQLELHSKIMDIPNFFDRISFKYNLNPLDINETKEMIEFRVRQAGYRSRMYLFLDDAIREIYKYSRGYPRQITMLCHRALKNLVLKNKFVVDAALVHEMMDEEIKSGWYRKDLYPQKSGY